MKVSQFYEKFKETIGYFDPVPSSNPGENGVAPEPVSGSDLIPSLLLLPILLWA